MEAKGHEVHKSGCDVIFPAMQVIGRQSHLRDATQYAVSESPMLRPQTALEEQSRPRIIGSHVLVWLDRKNLDDCVHACM